MAGRVTGTVSRILRSVCNTSVGGGKTLGEGRTLFTSAWGGGGGRPKWLVTWKNILSVSWQGVRSRSALHSWTIWNTSRRETTFVISRTRQTPAVTLAYLLPLTFPLAQLLFIPVACDNQKETCSTKAQPEAEVTNNDSNNSLCCPPPPPSAQKCSPPQPASNSDGECKKDTKSSAVNTSCAKEDSCSKKFGKAPINWCLEEDLSHAMLIKQANQITVDSVTRLITQTISAYEEYHEEYRRLMDLLMDALEESRKAQGLCLELLDCKLLMLRSKVEDMKCAITELESYLYSVQKLSDAAAETAYLGHAEYASVAMSERMQSAAIQMKNIKEESLRKERDMMELQTVVIVEAGKSLK